MEKNSLIAEHVAITKTWTKITPVSIPWGELDSVLTWCKTSCQKDWRWTQNSTDMHSPGADYRFYFEDMRDAVAFRLKWNLNNVALHKYP